MTLFSTNLKVLVIHHDTIILDQIQKICERCHYLVTKCTSPSYALNLLAERYGYFDMMLIHVGMSNVDSYDFVQYVTIEHIISVIVHGACDYWVQPFHEKQFKTMWQHVARKTLIQNKEVLGFLNAQTHKEPEVLEILDALSHKEDEVLGFLEAQTHKQLGVHGFLKAQSHKEYGVLGFLEASSHKEDEFLGFLEIQSRKEDEVLGFLKATRHEIKREREDDKPPKEKVQNRISHH